MLHEVIITASGIGIGLAMDAFAVAVSNGMAIPKLRIRHCIKTGLFFGFFQLAMPVIGWMGGISFSQYVEVYAHWIAFILLVMIGAKMVYETWREGREGKINKKEIKNPLDFKVLTVLAIATSIDALLVGVSFAAGGMHVMDLCMSSGIIGSVTFILSFLGMRFGGKTGSKLQNKAGFLGGFILITIGIKILLEGLHLLHI